MNTFGKKIINYKGGTLAALTVPPLDPPGQEAASRPIWWRFAPPLPILIDRNNFLYILYEVTLIKIKINDFILKDFFVFLAITFDTKWSKFEKMGTIRIKKKS